MNDNKETQEKENRPKKTKLRITFTNGKTKEFSIGDGVLNGIMIGASFVGGVLAGALCFSGNSKA